jgi:hypothetical protein
MIKIYLASPYSHPDVKIREERFIAACKKAGQLMFQGHLVHAPIVHSHPIAIQCKLPTDWSFWERYDIEYIKWADEVWVLCLPGWDGSIGIEAEISIAKKMGKPVVYLQGMRDD